ncbi:MAG: T9SS type A sorting domain-containing protein, partial [bacterium]|nr:T9SS type A sorting domain-containing protein [bacterium]
SFELRQNYPNPFNPTTTIEFAIPKSAFVTLNIYNLLGEEIATLVAEQRTAGIHRVNWDAKGLASGVYLYRLEAGEFVRTKKLILMR